MSSSPHFATLAAIMNLWFSKLIELFLSNQITVKSNHCQDGEKRRKISFVFTSKTFKVPHYFCIVSIFSYPPPPFFRAFLFLFFFTNQTLKFKSTKKLFELKRNFYLKVDIKSTYKQD